MRRIVILVALCLLSAHCKPLVLFKIDSGFPTELVQSYANSTVYDGLLARLERALTPLRPLCAWYAVGILIDPCYLYLPAAVEPLDRVNPALHAVFGHLSSNTAECVQVYLDAYATDIMTQQQGPRNGPLPPAPLYNASGPGRLGWVMDLAAYAALATQYPRTFAGLRFHELYGADINARLGSAGFPLDPEVWESTAVMAKAANLTLIINDSSWMIDSEPENDGGYHYVYNASARPYALADRTSSLQMQMANVLGANLVFTYANNNYHPTPSLDFLFARVGTSSPGCPRQVPPYLQFSQTVNAFPLRNSTFGSRWGVSVQDWCWSEFTNTLVGQYFASHLDAPVEMLAVSALVALAQGAAVVQFEAPSYLFTTADAPGVVLSYDPGTYAPTPALMRLVSWLAGSGAPLPTNESELWDIDQQRFLENWIQSPPISYWQSSAFVLGAQLNASVVLDTFSWSKGEWREDSGWRTLPFMFPPAVSSIVQFEATGDGVDETAVITVANAVVTAQVFRAWGDVMGPASTSPPLSCPCVASGAGNMQPSDRLDADELLLLLQCSSAPLAVAAYKLTNGVVDLSSPAVVYNITLPAPCESTGADCTVIGMNGFRTGAPVVSVRSFTRPMDGLCVFVLTNKASSVVVACATTLEAGVLNPLRVSLVLSPSSAYVAASGRPLLSLGDTSVIPGGAARTGLLALNLQSTALETYEYAADETFVPTKCPPVKVPNLVALQPVRLLAVRRAMAYVTP